MESKIVAKSFYESYNRKNIDKSFDDFIDLDLVNHTMGGGLDREKWLEFDKALLTACPDLELVVKEQIMEGNKVVTHWAFKGTHTGGFMDMAATGKVIRLAGVSIDAIENGKIKEHVAMADFTGLMGQFSS